MLEFFPSFKLQYCCFTGELPWNMVFFFEVFIKILPYFSIIFFSKIFMYMGVLSLVCFGPLALQTVEPLAGSARLGPPREPLGGYWHKDPLKGGEAAQRGRARPATPRHAPPRHRQQTSAAGGSLTNHNPVSRCSARVGPCPAKICYEAKQGSKSPKTITL